MRTHLLKPSDPQWELALDSLSHDVYHLSWYVDLEARRTGGTPTAVFVEDDLGTVLFWPLLLHPIPDHLRAPGVLDAVSPYGYASPLLAPTRSDIDHANAIESALQTLKAVGVCCAFARLHPLLPTRFHVLEKAGAVVEHGPTVWFDLKKPADVLWSEMRSTSRNLIGRLRRQGFSTTIYESPSADTVTAFAKIYHATMRRVGASLSYFFSDSYFRDILANGAGMYRLATVERDNTIAAAALFSECSGIVQYHLSGTADEFLADAPTRVLLDTARAWAASRGNWALHLGGGLGGQTDGLFAFKAGLARSRSAFCSWRVITCHQTYDRLIESAGLPPGDLSGFFPAYRAT